MLPQGFILLLWLLIVSIFLLCLCFFSRSFSISRSVKDSFTWDSGFLSMA